MAKPGVLKRMIDGRRRPIGDILASNVRCQHVVFDETVHSMECRVRHRIGVTGNRREQSQRRTRQLELRYLRLVLCKSRQQLMEEERGGMGRGPSTRYAVDCWPRSSMPVSSGDISSIQLAA
ncbi:hypothetical protein Rcae01_00308 [Novipirellula caenicola]|uniref:Uncharacterized protein n=1 Tax=Novipirellula caenicola TaxID=1536901 RepID=A0ABP9VI37_9BACT